MQLVMVKNLVLASMFACESVFQVKHVLFYQTCIVQGNLFYKGMPVKLVCGVLYTLKHAVICMMLVEFLTCVFLLKFFQMYFFSSCMRVQRIVIHVQICLRKYIKHWPNSYVKLSRFFASTQQIYIDFLFFNSKPKYVEESVTELAAR